MALFLKTGKIYAEIKSGLNSDGKRRAHAAMP